jgi:hypothetical protein
MHDTHRDHPARRLRPQRVKLVEYLLRKRGRFYYGAADEFIDQVGKFHPDVLRDADAILEAIGV